MKKKNIRIFESVGELGKFSLKWLASRVKEVPDNEFFTVALSGGTTPKQLFEYIALHGKYSLNWNKILFFWVDERCVPPDSSESNYGMTRLSLLDRLNIPENHVFRMFGEADPEEEALRYSRILLGNVPLANDFPRFDLVLLGLGEDGHTASIFPGNTQLFESRQFCETVKHPQTHQQRITLTGNVINNASEIAFIVTGHSKAEIISNVLNKQDAAYPASLVVPVHGHLTWLLDKEAVPSGN